MVACWLPKLLKVRSRLCQSRFLQRNWKANIIAASRSTKLTRSCTVPNSNCLERFQTPEFETCYYAALCCRTNMLAKNRLRYSRERARHKIGKPWQNDPIFTPRRCIDRPLPSRGRAPRAARSRRTSSRRSRASRAATPGRSPTAPSPPQPLGKTFCIQSRTSCLKLTFDDIGRSDGRAV